MNKNIKYISPVHYAEVVLRLSQKISVLAQQHDWEKARDLESQRNLVMQQLFSHPDIDAALPSMTALLSKVMELDAEVIVKGESELELMALQLKELGKGKRAVNAYLKT